MKIKELKKLVNKSKHDYDYNYSGCPRRYDMTDYCEDKCCNECWELAIKQEINRKIKVLTDLLERMDEQDV